MGMIVFICLYYYYACLLKKFLYYIGEQLINSDVLV